MIAVAQMIDSLEKGGAEAMAINLANELSKLTQYQSYLVVSRGKVVAEGLVMPAVKVIALHKRGRFDLIAIAKLARVIKLNNISIVHAHSTSFFSALIARLFIAFKIVWHDHHGGKLAGHHPYMKPFWAKKFDAILCASNPLAALSRQMTGNKQKHVSCFPNFVVNCHGNRQFTNSTMQEGRTVSILCVANFRPQKDHFNLLNALSILKGQQVPFKAVLSGFVYDEGYYQQVISQLNRLRLNDDVTIVKNSGEVRALMAKADIGVISSSSEGMPLVLLEYACVPLPVVTTMVGEIAKSFDENMVWMVQPENAQMLAEALQAAIKDKQASNQKAIALHNKVQKDFGADEATARLHEIYLSILP